MIDKPSPPHDGPTENVGKRPAAHRCFACDIKVDMSLDDDDQHVCVPDPAGPVRSYGQRWRATTVKLAREAREDRVRRGGGR